MTNYVLNPGTKRRRKRRKRRRNVWKGNRRGHRRAALLGWRRQKAKGRKRKKTTSRKRKARKTIRRSSRKTVSRKGRKRKMSRYTKDKIRATKLRKKYGLSSPASAPYGFGPTGRGVELKMGTRKIAPSIYSGSKRAANPRRGKFRYRGRNPMNIVGSITDAFNPGNLKTIAPMLGGMVAANMSRRWVGGQGFVPSMLQSGKPANLVIGVASAGLAAAAASMVAPRYSGAVLMGGVVEAVVGLVNTLTGMGVSGCSGCSGVGCIGCGSGIAGGPADAGVYFQPSNDVLPEAVAQPPAGDAIAPVDPAMVSAFESEDIF